MKNVFCLKIRKSTMLIESWWTINTKQFNEICNSENIEAKDRTVQIIINLFILENSIYIDMTSDNEYYLIYRQIDLENFDNVKSEKVFLKETYCSAYVSLFKSKVIYIYENKIDINLNNITTNTKNYVIDSDVPLKCYEYIDKNNLITDDEELIKLLTGYFKIKDNILNICTCTNTNKKELLYIFEQILNKSK